ncbi:hypothetical protein [Streptomyces alfalfae]
MLERLDCLISERTQDQLRALKLRHGSHTETVRRAVDILHLIDTADGTVETADGRPLHTGTDSRRP